MKTSKIIRIEKVKPWNGSNGTVYYHDCEMDNGDKISIGKKKELAIGEELMYEITDSGQEYNKAKSVMPMNESFGGGKFKGADQDAILYQVCLKEALNFIAIDGFCEVVDLADKCKYITDIALQLAMISKQNIATLKTK